LNGYRFSIERRRRRRRRRISPLSHSVCKRESHNEPFCRPPSPYEDPPPPIERCVTPGLSAAEMKSPRFSTKGTERPRGRGRACLNGWGHFRAYSTWKCILRRRAGAFCPITQAVHERTKRSLRLLFGEVCCANLGAVSSPSSSVAACLLSSRESSFRRFNGPLQLGGGGGREGGGPEMRVKCRENGFQG